jgi:hypothetical protein
MDNTKLKRFNHTCEQCNFTATRPCEWLLHIKSEKHLRDGKIKSKFDKNYYILKISTY